MQVTPVGSPARNWAFDVTPARYVTGLITERGVCAASESGLRGLFPDFAPGTKVRGKDRKRTMAHRAIADLNGWLNPQKEAAE